MNRSALKAISCGCALIAFSQLTAATAIASYAVLIFQKVGLSIDPYKSTIILGLALICGSMCSTFLADKLGRKTLNLISLFGAACGHCVTAVFYYLSINGYNLSAYSFLPVLSMSFCIFIAAVGIMPLAFVCSVEILPPKVRIESKLICVSEKTNWIPFFLLSTFFCRFVQMEWESFAVHSVYLHLYHKKCSQFYQHELISMVF